MDFIYPKPNKDNEIILKFKSLRESMIVALHNFDANTGTAIQDDGEWSDNYQLHEYTDDFFGLRNKNPKEQKIKNIMSKLSSVIDNYKHTLIPSNIFHENYDVTGSYVDINKYMDNDPYCMVNFIESKPNKNINLFFNVGAIYSDSDELELIGIIMFCLLKILKNKMINVYGYTNANNELFSFIPIINNQLTIINPQVELSLLNLKAYFRKIIFAIWEGLEDTHRHRIGIYKECGYGHTLNCTEEDIYRLYGIKPDILIKKIESARIDKACHDVVKQIVDKLA